MTALYVIRGPFDPERDLPASTEAIEVEDKIYECFRAFCTFVSNASQMLAAVAAGGRDTALPAPRIADNDYVFATSRRGDKPPSGFSVAKMKFAICIPARST